MAKPETCSDEIYSIMIKCWHYQPHERPSFSTLVEKFDRILTLTANTVYLKFEELPPLESPCISLEALSGEESQVKHSPETEVCRSDQ